MITRAPNPANKNEANGPARACVRSRTVRPDNGLEDSAGCVLRDMSAESNNRLQEALRLCPSMRKTWHVFRVTT